MSGGGGLKVCGGLLVVQKWQPRRRELQQCEAEEVRSEIKAEEPRGAREWPRGAPSFRHT